MVRLHSSRRALVCASLAVAILICSLTSSAAGMSLLSPDDLKSLKPQYEQFLNSAADLLVRKELLDPDRRADWIAFQLADYTLNGGYGTIEIMYSPDLLGSVTPEEMALRISGDAGEGVLRVDTMRAYSPGYTTMPGLPIDLLYTTHAGEPIECAFKWFASSGKLMIWDSHSEEPVSFGATIITGGEQVFWTDDPLKDDVVTITIEILSLDSSDTLGQYNLKVTSDGVRWSVLEDGQ